MHCKTRMIVMSIFLISVVPTLDTAQVSFTASWQDSPDYVFQGSCQLPLLQKYQEGEWRMMVSTSVSINSISVDRMVQISQGSNTVIFTNQYIEHTGTNSLTVWFRRSIQDSFTAHCDDVTLAGTTTTTTTTSTPSSPPSSISASTTSGASNTTLTNMTSHNHSVVTNCSTTGQQTTTANSLLPTTVSRYSTNVTLTYNPETTTCFCFGISNSRLNIDDIIASLKIDKKSTAQARSRLSCRTDNRPSVRAVGGIGILLMLTFIGLIVFSDADILWKTLMNIKTLTRTDKPSSIYI